MVSPVWESAGVTGSAADDAAWDFFVSYTQADRAWAEWIAWLLEEDGYRVLVQAWDMVAGSNWISRVDRGVARATRTVAVLSPDYQLSVYGAAEWQAACGGDPQGVGRKLIVVRVRGDWPAGLLAGVVGVDLVGLSEAAARRRLRDDIAAAVRGRAKPGSPPPFPLRAVSAEPRFPGALPEASTVPGRDPHVTGRSAELDTAHARFGVGTTTTVQAVCGVGGLPGEVTHFTGRDGPMAELRAQIAEQVPPGAAVTIYAIDGMAGVGKTAFARHAGQEFAKCYPDGAIWIDLYGHTPGMAPREPSGALEQMLLQLGVPPEAIQAGLAERQDQWRHQMHMRRMLIVLDNARTSDQVLPLLPDGPGCLVLITSRRKLTGLTDAYPLSLDVLGCDEAKRLFIKLVGEHRCEDRQAVRQILTACGRLPLAIRLIAGRLRHHRGELLADVVTDLADQTAALDALIAEHLSVRAAFEWSYRLLTGEQRRAFRLLGWHPGPEITPMVIAAIADVPVIQGRQLLRELLDHNLLDQLSVPGIPGGPRYRMHDLVRLYARERADAEEPPTERAAAMDRLASSYLAIARQADRLLRTYALDNRDKSTIRGTTVALADAAQARIWLTAERHNLRACVQAVDLTTEVADLSTLLAAHFCEFGFWSDTRYLYGQALTGYQHLGDRRGEVDALRGLGDVEWLVAEYDQAREYHTQTLTLARQLGYQRGEADALRGLGHVKRLVGEYDQAHEYYTRALTLTRQLGYQRGEADALWGLGHVKRHVGEYDQAHEYYTRALTLTRQLGYQRGEADALWGLGEIAWFGGEYDEAREYYTQALTLTRQLGYQRGEAEALWGLGEVERLVGKYDQARDYHTQALTLTRQLGYRPVEALALRGLGDVERHVSQYDEAHEYYTQALTLARQLGYRRAEAEALRRLGEVAWFGGEYDKTR
jgi:tetratricopeptide (TPR) repeat protein